MRTNLIRRLLCLRVFFEALFLLAPVRAAEVPEPQFPPPPRLATSAAELARWKQTGDFESRKQAAVQKADALLKSPVTIPTEWGNWIFYYACNDDGTSLQPVSLTEHRCPKCGKTQTDERTVAAYRTQLNYQADQAALDLGWAFILSNDPRYATEVRRILMAYAAAYPNYPMRRDRWGRNGLLATIGGRRYCQSLDEAVGILSLAKAYDLTRSASIWTDADKQLVEKELFQAVASVLRFWNYGTINHQTWYNAGLMAIANVTADAELAKKVVTMRGGYHDQLERAIGPDGMWREGTMAYHGYALQAMEELVDAARGLNLGLEKDPRLLKMFEFPFAYAYPNGQFPAINDSDPMNLSGFETHLQWARKTFGDSFSIPDSGGQAKQAYDLPGAGVAVLRIGQGDNAACAMLDYGEHGGAHGHPDKMQLLLFAAGREWLLDPGRLSYSHREHQTWYRQTAAHNTVIIDGRSQAPATGELTSIESTATDRSCSAVCTTAYPGVTIKRSLVLLDDALIDLTFVESASAKKIDWLIHANADSITLTGATSEKRNDPLGKQDGYEHLSDILQWNFSSNVSASGKTATLTAGSQQLHVWLVSNTDEEIYSAKCPGYSLEPRIPCLVRRVAGANARFGAVYDWSSGRRRITGASIEASGQITVARADGTRVTYFRQQP